MNASEITIKWPYELASRYRHGKHLLYLMQPPQVSSGLIVHISERMDNLGPGTVNASEITIKWPYDLASRYRHGKHLLYLMQHPQVSSGLMGPY